MSRTRKKAIIVCPGRGTYNKSELGYLYRFHADKGDFIRSIDEHRKQSQQTTITELDQAKVFDPRMHTRGDNASSLIYACAYADFLSIDPEQFEIVAITGNSMAGLLQATSKIKRPNKGICFQFIKILDRYDQD